MASTSESDPAIIGRSRRIPLIHSQPGNCSIVISPQCDRCKSELKDFGALAFSPPNQQNQVTKYHLCVACFERFQNWLHSRPSLFEGSILGHSRNASMIAQKILDGADVNEVLERESGYTPLHIAAVNGAMENVRILLKAGANPNLRNALGNTPEQEAEKNGQSETAKLIRELTVSMKQ